MQNYVDHDPSPAVKDYACGGQTYDGHDGTDIRLLSTVSKADVIASASGIVSGVRDGIVDHLIRDKADNAAFGDLKCGNGVVINHGGGWQTQYCHMRNGSVIAKTGDRVMVGTKLGEVGYSGFTQFPHVHLTVRNNGKALDPFGGKPDGGESCGAPENPLWNASARAILNYNKGGVIQSGFNPADIELAGLETGALPQQNLDSAWPAMVAYAWTINLARGDTVTVALRGPDGIEATNTTTLDRNKAVYLLFAGKKRPADGWPKGNYVGSLTVSNEGELRLSQEWRATLE